MNPTGLRMIDPDSVTRLLREAADEAILPRFRRLRAGDIVEKSPGELVTCADRDVEEMLIRSLVPLIPGSRLIGEEGCAARPELLERIGEGTIWLLDPLDGTANFAAGNPPFAVMLALLRDGEALASWMIDPLSEDAWTAELGGGAWRSGERLRTDPRVPPPEDMRGPLVSRFMPEAVERKVRSRLGAVRPLEKLMCSGAEYPAVALGERHLSLFWRTLPWDHLPGALFLTEAGGKVTRLDGSPYRGDIQGEGLIVAHNPGIAELVARALAG